MNSLNQTVIFTLSLYFVLPVDHFTRIYAKEHFEPHRKQIKKKITISRCFEVWSQTPAELTRYRSYFTPSKIRLSFAEKNKTNTSTFTSFDGSTWHKVPNRKAI